MRKSKHLKGFTLIELLLVLVILAALAAAIVPKFTNRAGDAKINATKTAISNLEVALDAFEIDNGRFPTNSEGLRVLYEQPSNLLEWKGPYIKQGIPRDAWQQEFIYRQPGQYNQYSYDLSSMGPDMQAGNDDDIVNWSRDEY